MTEPGYLPVPQPDTQPLEHVLAVLRLEQLGPTRFRARSLPEITGRIYGGQVMAQALIAAGTTVEQAGVGERLPHSMHGYFLRPGKLDRETEIEVDILHDGRSFSTRRSLAIQDGKPILSMIYSFQLPQEGLDHQEPAPAVTPPESLEPFSDQVNRSPFKAARNLTRFGAFDIRHVEEPIYLRPATDAEPRQALWMRTRVPLPSTTSQLLNRAIMAYACDQIMLEPVLRAHGLHWFTPGLSAASLDHAMWWHRPVDVSDWLLYVQDSPTATGGRGLGRALVYDRSGRHVATVAQEGMIRIPEAGEDGPGSPAPRPATPDA